MTTALAPRPTPVRDPVPRLRLLATDPPAHDPGRPAAVFPAARPAPVKDLRPTPDLQRRAHQVVGLVLEVLGGRRPLAHLAPHLDPRALRYVRAAVRPGTRPSRLQSLHVHRPAVGALEVAAVHRSGPRSRALAARFEGPDGAPDRWRCVTLRLL